MDNLIINLGDLWYKESEDLPKFVQYKRCIYRLHNLINYKNYIGQTRMSLIDRWRFAGLGHLINFNNGGDNHRYNAIRKYGPENFEVEILEYNLEICNLDSHEIYWIDKFESFGPKGYNKNKGGDNCEQLNTKEAREKALKVNRMNHGGILACHTPEAYETQKRNHGGVLAIHTPEVREKALKVNRRNHGGILSWNTPEAYETQRRSHGGVLAIHTPEALKLGQFRKRRTNLYKTLDLIKLMISSASNDLSDNFVFTNKDIYDKYKISGSTKYTKWTINHLFNRCIEFNVDESDLKFIIPHFPKDYVPEELHKYYND